MRFWISPSEPVESAARTINPLQHIEHTLCRAKLIRNERSKLRLECVPWGSSSVQVFQKLLDVSRWNRPARSLTLVPIAQRRERARPKRQVAGESPAGDTSFCGCGSTAEFGRAKGETTVRFRSPAPFRGRSSPAERSFDMREAERAALSAPTIFSRAQHKGSKRSTRIKRWLLDGHHRRRLRLQKRDSSTKGPTCVCSSNR